MFGSIADTNEPSIAMCKKAGFGIVDRPDLASKIEQSLLDRTGSSSRQIMVMYDEPT